jgi:hypothetical protein
LLDPLILAMALSNQNFVESFGIWEAKTTLARRCEAGPGVSPENCQCFSPEIEALRLYPPFYPPMETFGHYLSAREIMRFSRIT